MAAQKHLQVSSCDREMGDTNSLSNSQSQRLRYQEIGPTTNICPLN